MSRVGSLTDIEIARLEGELAMEQAKCADLLARIDELETDLRARQAKIDDLVARALAHQGLDPNKNDLTTADRRFLAGLEGM